MSTATSADDAAAPAVRSSKRKRDQVSYLQDDYYDELEVEEPEHLEEADSDDDGAYGRKRSIKKPVQRKKAKKAPKPKKVKPFRFMDLSAELRNEIYELALTEEDGITLVTQTRQLRRRVARGTITIEQGTSYFGKQRRTGGYRSYWRLAQPTQSITTGRAHRQLSPNLLAVSKQIREEGSSILYRQDLIFEDMMSLHAFIAQIGTYNQKLVTELTVKSWSNNAGIAKAYNFAGLTSLAACTSLQVLSFDCSLGRYRSPTHLARQIYKDGFHLLEALMATHGTAAAAVDVLDVSDWHFDKNAKTGRKKKIDYDPKMEQEFVDELVALLE